MAKKSSKVINLKPVEKAPDYKSAEELQDEWSHADDALVKLRPMWRDNEKLFFDQNKGKLGEQSTKSNVNDGHLSTAVIQRTQRVMAQPPTGQIISTDTLNDKGKGIFLNFLMDNYVKKYDNIQYSHLTKLKLTVIGSHIYGSQPVLVDKVTTNSYNGPTFWIIPIDQYYPQPGVFSSMDQEYCFVDSWVSKKWLLSRDTKTWKNIDKLLDAIKEKEGKAKNTYPHQTYAETTWGGTDYGGKGDHSRILIRTKYLNDQWLTYAPGFEKEAGVVRDIANPQDNDLIPVLVKETIPLIDRAVGRGDIERGAPVQKATNSFINLAMDSAKMGLLPPTIVNKKGVVPSSMRWSPGAFWEEIIPNSIRPMETSPMPINYFNTYIGFLISTMNNMLGTTDLSVSKQVDQTMGKTPQALRMQDAKESAADAWERQSVEEFVERLYDRMTDLLGNKQDKPIDLTPFSGELKKIAASYPDIQDLIDNTGDKVVIKPESMNGAYKFSVDTGSTLKKDKQQENQTLQGIMQLLLNPQVGPMVRAELQKKKKDIDLGELISQWVNTSSLSNPEKIITDYKPEEQSQGQLPEGMPGQPSLAGMQEQPGQMPQGPAPNQPPQFDPTSIRDPQILQAAQNLFNGGM